MKHFRIKLNFWYTIVTSEGPQIIANYDTFLITAETEELAIDKLNKIINQNKELPQYYDIVSIKEIEFNE